MEQSSNSIEPKDKDTFDQDTSEDALLEALGYHAEFKRSFGLLGMIGFSFSIVTCWTALSGVLIIGVESGGPPVMIWSWLGICAVTLAVAYSLAEMCSAYPVAGGQYSWVAVLAPKRIARGMSYISGWFMLIGILAMGATNNFIGANFILGMANLANPDYVIERWHTVLVTYLIAFLAMTSNIFLTKFLDRLSRFILVWNIVSFFVVIITILACNDNKQSASFVFSDFQNFTGFSSSYTAILGIVQSAFGMCCYDAPSHMVEEMKQARKSAPRAIVMSVYLGAITGFCFLVAVCFCIGDLESTATSSTGVPLIQIFYDSTGSVRGACALTSLITVIVLVCANSLMAEGGRAVFAFARDHGLPFSNIWSTVERKKKVPVFALMLTTTVQIAFNSIYFGNLTGFNTVITVATFGFYISYAMPLLARLLSRVTNPSDPSHSAGLGGPYSLGRWGIPLNLLGFVFLVFNGTIFNFPTIKPVNSDTMNYTPAAIGVIMLISIITWVTTGHRYFTGPEAGNVIRLVQGVEGENANASAVEGEKNKEHGS
ncbi:uncharacterized protein PV09_04346 [Verruconis gallopava]|uniref:GABA permease n=1 Tax=Verruconis gallopava TaxID=253628 RepID=A0A0D2ACI6_9PEZI|nr:uncharacterized protein PV09_04346 [Verruconis gallopava]KIW04598.1 hypothetical protein PV09_04346 [Verruconis gallopava]